MTEKGPLRSIRDRVFDGTACFLCGTDLDNTNNSDEHVFAKWMLRRFNLWNRSLVLLDGTWIPYSQLVIPCCQTCNNSHLSDVETKVKQAAEKGCEGLRALDPATLYLWISKIFLGILYKEMLKARGRRRDSPETIILIDHFQRYEMMLFWLQFVRLKRQFKDYTPGSVFVFPTIEPDDVVFQFDYFDLPSVPACALRLGPVGFICHLLDNGLHKQVGSQMREKYQTIPLHPLQFRELGAMEFYQGELSEQECRIDVVEGGADALFTIQWHTPVGRSTTEARDPARYAVILSSIMGMPKEQLFVPPRKIWTCLHDPQGNVTDLRDAKVDLGEFYDGVAKSMQKANAAAGGQAQAT